MIPHGTITGHAAGCKSDVNCLARYEGQRTCKQVDLLHRGDYRFRKQILAGMTPAEILAAEKVAEAEALAARLVAKEAAIRERKARAVAEKRANAKTATGSKARGDHVHGTPHGAARGCSSETDCPGIAAVGIACIVARRAYNTAKYQERKAKASK